MGKHEKEDKNHDEEVKKVKKPTKDKDSTKVSKSDQKDKKQKDSKKEKKEKDDNKEGGFLDTVKNIAEKAVPIIEQVLPFVKIAVDKLFKKAPEKITENPSEQEAIAAIASSPASLAAITQVLQNAVPALVVAPSETVESTDASKAESIESKLPKILAGHDPKDLINILSYLVNTLGKVVDKSPDTQATINTNTTVEIDKSGVKPMIKVTPNEQVAVTEASREINTEVNDVDLAGAVADLHVDDHA